MHSNRDKSFDFDQDELRNRSIEEQFENDAQVWQAYLNDTTVNSSGLSNEKKDIVKRIFTVLDQGYLQRKLGSGYEDVSTVNKELLEAQKQGKNNNQPPLTLAAVLSHGGRVTIKIPKLNKDDDPTTFIRWLIGQNNQLTPDSPTHIRAAATHTIGLEKNSSSRVEEKKLHLTNPKHILKLLTDFLRKRHLGINIGLGTKDKAAPDNGSYGHLYLHWKPPTEQEEGALMVGCENSAPGKKNRYGAVHDMRAKSDEFSPTGGEKFSNEKFANYRLQVGKVGGLEIELTRQQIKDLTAKRAQDFDLNKLNAPITKEFKLAKSPNSTRKIKHVIGQHRSVKQAPSTWVKAQITTEVTQDARAKESSRQDLDKAMENDWINAKPKPMR